MNKDATRTPLHVIGGSLGSGKTTLLRQLLSGEYGRVAVMINEFGEIDVDGSVIKGRNIDLVELAGGCVCCSLSGEFQAGVRELIDKASPEAILVETTGVAEADVLIEDIEDDMPEVRLETVVILVDADTAVRFPALGHVERQQIASADLVLINKIDLAERSDIDELRSRVREINPRVPLIETEHAAVDPALILALTPVRRRPRVRPGRQKSAHGHGMESFSWRAPGSLDEMRLARTVASWPAEVYRAKGPIRVNGRPRLLNYTAGRWQLDALDDGVAENVLVWIGPGIRRHEAGIIAGLEDCLERED